MKHINHSGFRTTSMLLLLGLACLRTIQAAGPFECWNKTYQTNSQRFQAVTFGRGIFVAVGYPGAILTSPNGRHWTPRSVGSIIGAAELESVTYGVMDGVEKFVAVGRVGTAIKIIHSTDGITWSGASTTSLPNTMLGVAFGDGWFVAVGNFGEVHRSNDGTNWMQIADVGGSTLNGIAYGGGMFLAVTISGDTFVSTDAGVNWRLGDFNLGSTTRAVVFGVDRFVIANTVGISLVTSDGTTGLSTNRFHGEAEALTYAQGYFVLAGVANNRAYIAFSANGVNWTDRPLADWSYRLKGLAYGNDLVVAVGEDAFNLNSGLILTHDTIPKAPEVTRLPENRVVTNGANVVFSFETWKTTEESYQWFLNGQPIGGATSRSQVVANVQPGDTGRYTVRVVNSLGSVTTTTGGLLTSYEQKRHAGLTLSNVIGSSVPVEFRDSLQPVDGWQVLTNLTLFQSPYLFIESEAATVHPQRYFRTATFTGSPTRLGMALYNGFRFWGLPGSFCAVEYRDTPTGPWNNLTSLTLTGTPHVWFDENSGNRPRRNYRFTASP